MNRSSYYKWQDRADARTARQVADRALAEQICAVDSDGASGGSPPSSASPPDP
ncbi:hypothetical protein [Streptomyces guryensis]|uniref:Uncharacterized protein n=1 Tax=Streptomyces guryensis TaxID=2886947 RepID=A0A9Q3Z9I2_9ACTN|nr:hypothetical protein [Streptomyces guryensis]MCD9876567.1 hypothetical protein [Streptomyces guryensis]